MNDAIKDGIFDCFVRRVEKKKSVEIVFRMLKRRDRDRISIVLVYCRGWIRERLEEGLQVASFDGLNPKQKIAPFKNKQEKNQQANLPERSKEKRKCHKHTCSEKDG